MYSKDNRQRHSGGSSYYRGGGGGGGDNRSYYGNNQRNSSGGGGRQYDDRKRGSGGLQSERSAPNQSKFQKTGWHCFDCLISPHLVQGIKWSDRIKL
jgi:hypothetical protein